MYQKWTLFPCISSIFFALFGCENEGGFSGNPQKNQPVAPNASCGNEPCKSGADAEKERSSAKDDAKKKVLADDDDDKDNSQNLPPTNPMKKECRGIFVGGAPFSPLQAYEAFEWNFNGDRVTGVVTYTRNGNLIAPPVRVTLSFRSRSNDEFIYEGMEIQSTGNKPEHLSFTCESDRMIQKEVWAPRARITDRTFVLKKK